MYLFLCAVQESTTIEFQSADGKSEFVKEIKTNKGLVNCLLKTINQFLQDRKLAWSDLDGVAVFAGPGPFTALRIVHAIANTIGFSCDCPVANSDNKESWRTDCLNQIKDGKKQIIVPVYGRPPNITTPKK